MKPDKYFMCADCGKKLGGVLTGNDAITMHEGTCAHCEKEFATLIPWTDFDWPLDKEKSIRARANRD